MWTSRRRPEHRPHLRPYGVGEADTRRVRGIVDRIQRGESLAPEDPAPSGLVHRLSTEGSPLYSNIDEQLGIDFSVDRIPFASDVFDTRILRISPGRNCERHKHPHESIFYVVKGRGRVHVNRAVVEIGAGDLVFVPRWTLHQSYNIGDEELVIVALTDFVLTESVFLGDHIKTTRLKAFQAQRT